MSKDINCFAKEDIGSKIETFGDNAVIINGTPVFIRDGYGKLSNAYWNHEGALVLEDDNGNKHFFIGSNHDYIAHKGEDSPHEDYVYKEEVRKCQAKRAKSEKNNNSNSKSSKKSKSPLWWRLTKWLGKGLLKLFGLGFLIVISDDQKD